MSRLVVSRNLANSLGSKVTHQPMKNQAWMLAGPLSIQKRDLQYQYKSLFLFNAVQWIVDRSHLHFPTIKKTYANKRKV
jgi:hypothetical protein